VTETYELDTPTWFATVDALIDRALTASRDRRYLYLDALRALNCDSSADALVEVFRVSDSLTDSHSVRVP